MVNMHWIFFISFAVSSTLGDPIVSLGDGQVQGTLLTVEGYDDSFVFYAIPYADAPVGDFRFNSPQPVPQWDGIRDCTKPGPACSQPPLDPRMPYYLGFSPYDQFKYSEDCLTLDVYTKLVNEKRPVMVYIHGGALQNGLSSVYYDFRAYAAAKDIVMVSMQYRLGALGWASTGDEEMPGNYGFQDQIQALQWVQENIHHFGGNPDDVTLFGESAGAWCVTMHLISPMSKGLFKRAIAQSGAMPHPNSNPPTSKSRELTTRLAECIGCPTDSHFAMMDCFRQLPHDHFSPSESRPCLRGLLHGFRVDGTFIPDVPETLLKNKDYNTEMDVIMGDVLNEGYFLLAVSAPFLVSPEMSIEKLEDFIFSDMSKRYSELPDHTREAMVKEALKTYLRTTTNEGIVEAVSTFFGDSLLLWPCTSFALSLSETLQGKIHFYEMRHRHSKSRRPHYIRSDHLDDLIFIQGAHLTGQVGLLAADFSEEDKAVSEVVFNAWTNFALHGDPNGDGVPNWPEFEPLLTPYMVLDREPHPEVNYQALRINFWRHTLPRLSKNLSACTDLY